MPDALIVAHGSPADPDPQEDRLHALAANVGALLPDWRVQGATLAAEGALEAALDALERPLIYPFFMAEGWFTGTNLPRRLKSAGYEGLTQLRPFGTDPALIDLMAAAATRAMGDETTLLIAAHGSKISRTSGDTTYAMADALAARTAFTTIKCGFVEEAPFLADVATDMGRGVCLPFFALRAGHVLGDIPDALEQAAFTGAHLPPIGEDAGVPALIAAALQRQNLSER